MTQEHLSTPTSDIQLPTSPCNYAIIVAGGSGSRMLSATPKQFLLLNGLPVLMHTIKAFHRCESKPTIIVVLPLDYHQYWADLCGLYSFTVPHQIISGGDTRFQSVKNALNGLSDNAVIAVHDAVRPLTGTDIIDHSFEYARQHGNAVVAVQSRDSVRRLKGGQSEALNRDEIYLVQTPQTFQSALLKRAYDQAFNSIFTDDASVVEQTGVGINIIPGEHTNIKITFPEDIAIAGLLLK